MNDQSLANLLMELDEELGRQNDRDCAALTILDHVEALVPGAIMKSAATLQLRSQGCSISGR